MNRSKLLLVPTLTVCLCSCGVAAPELPAHSADRSSRAVPAVDGKSLPGAYAELHRDGFRVTFTHAFSVDWSGECVPLVTSSAPSGGRDVARGSTIILSTKIPGCALASPAHPVPLPGPYRVPSFSGKRLSVAIGWVTAHELLWAAAIPGLHRGAAAGLYANYVITTQKPRAGAKLTVGVFVSGGWQPTPLRLTVRSSAA